MAAKRDPKTGLTPQMEAFAQAIASGMNQTQAYLAAYPTSQKWKRDAVYCQSSHLATDSKVLARIEALRKPAQRAAEISVATVTAMLLEDRELARQEKQSSAAVAALLGVAKLHGLLIDKSERGKPGDFANLSAEETREMLTAVQDELAKRRAAKQAKQAKQA